jgi:hypothetical protein
VSLFTVLKRTEIELSMEADATSSHVGSCLGMVLIVFHTKRLM